MADLSAADTMRLLQQVWGRAVDVPGYDKDVWKALEAQVRQLLAFEAEHRCTDRPEAMSPRTLGWANGHQNSMGRLEQYAQYALAGLLANPSMLGRAVNNPGEVAVAAFNLGEAMVAEVERRMG